jgi:hypothetical protein
MVPTCVIGVFTVHFLERALFTQKVGDQQIDPHSSPFVPEAYVSIQFEHRDATGSGLSALVPSLASWTI